MAKKTKEQPKSAELNPEKIRSGIIKLGRRINDLEDFDISTIQERWDPNIKALTIKINSTIAEIFGHDSIEYQNYHIFSLDTLPHTMGGGPSPLYKVHEGYKKGIDGTIIKLKSIKEILEEKNEDSGGDVENDNPSFDFWDDIHAKIKSVAKTRFESNHYADAVESALKEVNSCVKDIVKRKTGTELDGASLMRTAFSPKNPIIIFDDLSAESGKNIQQGYMDIFAGAMTGIRNPKAHDNIHITEDRARHFLYLTSLLMFKIDERI